MARGAMAARRTLAASRDSAGDARRSFVNRPLERAHERQYTILRSVAVEEVHKSDIVARTYGCRSAANVEGEPAADDSVDIRAAVLDPRRRAFPLVRLLVATNGDVQSRRVSLERAARPVGEPRTAVEERFHAAGSGDLEAHEHGKFDIIHFG